MGRYRNHLTLVITALYFLLEGCGDPFGPEELRGRIVFQDLSDDAVYQIVVMNADGSEVTRLTNDSDLGEQNTSPNWSPDGTKIAFQHGGLLGGSIFVMNADGTERTHILGGTPGGGRLAPDWSPDGSQIALASFMNTIHVMNADGTGLKIVAENPRGAGNPDWSPDGNRIAFHRVVDGNFEIFVVNEDGTGLLNLTNHPGGDEVPAWSPDGSKIAFARGEVGGGSSIFVMNADGTDQIRLTDNGGDSSPTWSPDGTRIAFRGPDGIYVMNADGSKRTRIHEGSSHAPDWH